MQLLCRVVCVSCACRVCRVCRACVRCVSNTDASTHAHSEYKKNTGMNSRTENLLRERGSIHGVDHIADQLIAYVFRCPVSLLHQGRNCET